MCPHPLGRLILSAGLLAAAVAAPTAGAAAGYGHERRSSFPSRYFAPYVDVSLYPPFALTQVARTAGTKFFTLAFIIDGGGCRAEWGGNVPPGQAPMLSDITALRAMGGDVIASFGGEAGVELAQACASVSSLQAQYQAVVDAYDLTHIGFDIEGAAIADPVSIDRRNKAIAGLQAAARKGGRRLSVSFTLPVMPSGLDANGLAFMRNVIVNRVDAHVVNIMAMDYGSSAPPDRMGRNAVEAANSTFSQLKSLYPAKTDSQIWSMIGITPMIGRNDVAPEVFTLHDARGLLAFAQRHDIGELAAWSEGRDRPCSNGGTYALSTCSGVAQHVLGFSRLFAPFTSGRVAH